MCYLKMKIACKFVSDCLGKILESLQKYTDRHRDINDNTLTDTETLTTIR